MRCNYKKLFFMGCFLFVAAVMVNAAHAGQEQPKTGTLSGQILDPGKKPVANAVVLFFNLTTGPPPNPQKYWRIPDDGFALQADGRFVKELAVGRYYVGVIKSPESGGDGQPRFEDWLYLDREDNGDLRAHSVVAGRNTDLGVMAGAEPYAFPANYKKVETTVQGTVADQESRPVPDIIVEAFLTATDMDGRPAFSSEKTDKQGRFTMRVNPGAYYLGIRMRYPAGSAVAEAVSQKEASGYRIKKPVRVTATEGEETKGVSIVVVTGTPANAKP